MKSFSHHGESVNSDFRIELRVCGSPFYFLKQAPTRSEGGESAGMGGIKVTSQCHGSGKVNNAASAVNSSISQDLRGLLMIASHWGGMCTQAANAFCGQDLDP